MKKVLAWFEGNAKKFQQLRAERAVVAADAKTRKKTIKTKEAWRLIVETSLFLVANKKFFGGLVGGFALVSYFLAGGVSQLDYNLIKQSSGSVVGDGLDSITTAFAYFGAALSGGLTEAPTELQSFLTGILTLLFWLVLIWSVRMITANKSIKLRDALYNGTTPFFSTIMILMTVVIQLIPAALGIFGYTILLTEQWITNIWLAMFYGVVAIALCLLSLYWLASSVIAAVIVALPGMYPWAALRGARSLVIGRRWDIMLRLVLAVVIQLIFWTFIMIPIFLLDGWLKLSWLPLVPIAVQLMTATSMTFTSVYIYKMYRSLLW